MAFLADPDATSITGATLNADGGWNAQRGSSSKKMRRSAVVGGADGECEMKIAVIGVGGLGGYYGGLLWRAGHDVAFIESQRRSIEACSVLCYHAGREMASGAVKSGPEA